MASIHVAIPIVRPGTLLHVENRNTFAYAFQQTKLARIWPLQRNVSYRPLCDELRGHLDVK